MERIEGMMNIRKGKCPNSMVKGNNANNGDGNGLRWRKWLEVDVDGIGRLHGKWFKVND